MRHIILTIILWAVAGWVAIKRAWDWVFPWRYLRNARRECKHCGTRQDTYSTNWADGHNATWWETMAPVFKCERINHGEPYPAPRDESKMEPWERFARAELDAELDKVDPNKQ